MFLALDTVFGQCSVAIIDKQGHVLYCQTKQGKREQTQQILPMIDTALADTKLALADLQGLVFNRGPGAFSGIRINTAVVQALSVAHDLPCVAISSLQILAQAAHEQYGVMSCYGVHDARMQQVYMASFAVADLPSQTTSQVASQTVSSNTQAILPAQIMQPTQTTECLLDYGNTTEQPLPLVGDGATLLTACQGQPLYPDLQLDAAILARLGAWQFMVKGGVPAEQALPVYLRNDAWKTLKQQGKMKG